MRLFVIDANVFAAFYRVSIGMSLDDMTADPSPFFSFDGGFGRIVLDDGKMIEQEWKNTVDREWCDAWLGDALIAGHIVLDKARSDVALVKLLNSHGFPVNGSRDIWYLRLMDSLVGKQSGLITEDLDFFQPDKKALNGNARRAFLTEGKGRLRKDLGKRGIDVRCVVCWLAA